MREILIFRLVAPVEYRIRARVVQSDSINQSKVLTQGRHKATHGQGEATSKHYHKGQQTLLSQSVTCLGGCT